jgi:molecular chaperone GrpE
MPLNCKETVMNSKKKEGEKGKMEILDSEETGELDEAPGSEEPSDIEPEDEEEREADDLQQKYIRLAADFENYKKRLVKEKADVVAYGNEELIKALLNVLDNLERALEHTESGDDSPALLEGVKLVHKQFVSCLEKFGVTSVNASTGTEFDPRIHQAIERVESSELSSDLILSQMLPGYMLKDRLLRPALVVVSKGTEESEGNGSVPGFTSADNS